MSEETTNTTQNQATSRESPASGVSAETRNPQQGQSTSKATAFSTHLAAAAKIDELLASEARVNLRRTRELAREGAVKSAKSTPRAFVPPARIIARPLHSQSWKTPFMALALAVVVSTFLCAGGMAYLFARPFAVAVASDAELRSLRDSVALLRRNVTELSDSVTVNRTALDAANKANNDRFARVTQNTDRAERDPSIPIIKADRVAEERAQTARPAPTDITGSIQQTQRVSNPPRDVIAGWRVRRAYDGAAVLEGKSAVIEVVLGQDVPDLGRIQEIKYENSRWVVTTSRGIILPGR